MFTITSTHLILSIDKVCTYLASYVVDMYSNFTDLRACMNFDLIVLVAMADAPGGSQGPLLHRRRICKGPRLGNTVIHAYIMY